MKNFNAMKKLRKWSAGIGLKEGKYAQEREFFLNPTENINWKVGCRVNFLVLMWDSTAWKNMTIFVLPCNEYRRMVHKTHSQTHIHMTSHNMHLRSVQRFLTNNWWYCFGSPSTRDNVPTEWKRANAVPVHRESDTEVTKNYDRASLTKIAVKIQEKITRNQMGDTLTAQTTFNLKTTSIQKTRLV